MSDKSGYKHCTDPTHERSPTNGRCLTCRSIAMKQWRAARRQGSPRVAQTEQGAPCKRCGGTERYTKNRTCVQCQRVHGQRYRGAVITTYSIPAEFTRWIMSPSPDLARV